MDEPIVDTHHHVWRVADTPWLQGPQKPRIFGAYEAIRRDYLVEEYLADATPTGVVQSVYVQVNVASGDEVAEVARIDSLSAQYGGPQAISAFADLSSPDLSGVLDAQLAAGRVRAIRQQLHWHENHQYCFAARADLFDDPAWRKGLAEVGARELMFELQIFPGQMAGAALLVRQFPGLTFILQHAGMLEDRSAKGWEDWRRGMKNLAVSPNCLVKLSGLGTFTRRCSEQDWQSVVEPTVEMFGPERCMFGSNFPIEKLWTSYAGLIDVVRSCLRRYEPAERAAILHGTATRVYALPNRFYAATDGSCG